jgi:Flp pilus assembly pilin Flp
MKAVISRFARDENGATAIEYSMIATGIAAALLALWQGFYGDFTGTWVNIGGTIAAAVQ